MMDSLLQRNDTRRPGKARTTKVHPRVEALESRALLTVNVFSSFSGLSSPPGSRLRPPDTDVAAGPRQIVETTNTGIQISDKAGNLLSTEDFGSFFAPLGTNSFLTDPVVTYDDQAQRFIVAMLDLEGLRPADPNPAHQKAYIDLAVSNSSTPTNVSTDFTEMHKIDVTETVDVLKFFGDYPKIGWNADAIVVTLNMYSFQGEGDYYSGVQVVSIDTSSVTDNNNATLDVFKNDRDYTNFTMAAAPMHDATPGGPMYFVQEGGAFGSQIDVVKMTNVLSNSATFTDTELTVPDYVIPDNAFQPGDTTTPSVATNDTRMLNAAWRGNHLVAAQTVGDPNQITGSFFGFPLGVAHARFYEFDTTSTPTLVQTGEINRGPGVSTYFPAIDIAPSKRLGFTYMQSSASQYVSMYVTGRLQNDPLGTMQTPVLAKAGEARLRLSDRAGDFAGLSADPEGNRFWAANEYATNAPSTNFPTNWGTFIAGFVIQGPDRTPAASSSAGLLDSSASQPAIEFPLLVITSKAKKQTDLDLALTN